jgi:hypothetical protein
MIVCKCATIEKISRWVVGEVGEALSCIVIQKIARRVGRGENGY